MSGTLAIDDLWGQAREGWRLGETLCAGCGAYHRMRGIVRAADLLGGAKTDGDALAPLLNAALRPGSRILIAGAGDTGQLAALQRHAKARPLTVTVFDLCPTPLAVIDRLGPLEGINIETGVRDLMKLPAGAVYDLISSHSMLPFLEPPDRLILLQAFRAALAPSGRLLITVPIIPPGLEQDRGAFHARREDELRERLARASEARAIMGAEFDEMLRRFAEHRSGRSLFTDPRGVLDLIEQAGFRVEQQAQGGNSRSPATVAVGRRNHMFLASPA